MDPKNQRTYVGRSGQMAVVAELLARGINVAIPEVDVGEDIFAFQDGGQLIDRVQVKTANAKALKDGGYSADISVSLRQLRAVDAPVLWYVFPIGLNEM